MQFRYELRRDTPNRQWLIVDQKLGKIVREYPYGQRRQAEGRLFLLDANERIVDLARQLVKK